MKPLTLRMEGFRHYRDPQTIAFSDGPCAIVGANGAGKSSILQAIEVALFGPEGRSLAPYVTWGHDSMTVELEFEHAGDIYRARRSSQRGRHLLDLERTSSSSRCSEARPGELEINATYTWESRTRETVKETQAELERLLGFSRATLRASSLLMQGDATAWVDRDPRDRKKVLADVLGLDLYGRLLDEARARRRAADTGIAENRGRLAVLQQQAAPLDELQDRARTLRQDLDETQRDLAAAAADVDRLAAQVADGEQRDRERRELQMQVETLDARAAGLRKVDLEATVAWEKADAIRQEIGRLEPLQRERDLVAAAAERAVEQDTARQRAIGERHQLEQRYDQAVADERRLLAERDAEMTAADKHVRDADMTEAGAVERCGHCGQQLDQEACANAARSSRDTASRHRARADELDQQIERALAAARGLGAEINLLVIPDEPDGLDGVRARLAELDRVPQDLAAARARLEQLDQAIAAANNPEHRQARDQAEADLERARARLAAAEPTPGLEGVRRQHAQAVARAKTLTGERDKLNVAATETATLLTLAETAAATAADLADELARAERASADLAELERAYGPNGIPLLILENVAVPAIEEHANEILARLALDYRVEIRTQTEKADGGLRDALDVIVTTGQGDAAFEQLSGSEKTRVAVALRVGLARLLAARRGADCRMLALDEPEGLDATVRPLLVDVLRDLEAARVFDQVLLVSHESDLRDAFDQTIQVERADGGWSRIAGTGAGDVLAAVMGEAA